MTHPTLTLEDSLFKRIMAWSNERFPIAHGIPFVSLYLCGALVGRFLGEDGPVTIALSDIVSSLIAWSFFLVLRVFDEHKDYELDCKNHPQRVLQSGMINLKHLKIMAGVSIVAQLLWSLFLDYGFGSASVAWIIAFGWTCLMGKEFFCGEWLEKRLTLYAFSHMLVMPMIMYWFAQIGHPRATLGIPLITLMIFSFAGGFTAEIVRKTRGPEEERDTVDSYSKIFGTKGSAYVVIGLLTISCALQALLCSQIVSGNFWVGYGVIALGYLAGMHSLFKFIQAPTAEKREKNEAMCGIAQLLGYLTILAAVIIERGVSWQLLAN